MEIIIGTEITGNRGFCSLDSYDPVVAARAGGHRYGLRRSFDDSGEVAWEITRVHSGAVGTRLDRGKCAAILLMDYVP